MQSSDHKASPKKKLLIVTDAWFPQVNGVVTVLSKTTTLLQKDGMDVVVVHPGLFNRAIPFFLYPDVPLLIFPDWRMREIFDREKPDYVHIATEWMLGVSARRLCLKRNISFTTSYHTNFPLYAIEYFKPRPFGLLMSHIARRYMRWFHFQAKAVMVSSEPLREELIQQGFGTVILWPFGVDTDLFKETEKQTTQYAFPHPVFVYFGRVAKEKNIEEYLRADLPGTKLVIGDGPERKRLERKYGDGALFVGYKRGHDLIEMLSQCDVFVFTSRTETFGLTILEALACGIPVAAHETLGPQGIITHGVDGFLGEDLRTAALKCLTLSRKRCRDTALRYSWDTSAVIFKKNIETYI